MTAFTLRLGQHTLEDSTPAWKPGPPREGDLAAVWVRKPAGLVAGPPGWAVASGSGGPDGSLFWRILAAQDEDSAVTFCAPGAVAWEVDVLAVEAGTFALPGEITVGERSAWSREAEVLGRETAVRWSGHD